jgi:serine/threonine protein kinase
MTLLSLADKELPSAPRCPRQRSSSYGGELLPAGDSRQVRELQPGDPRHIGPYRLLGQLGSGGMGRVFLGLSAGGRRVAVKIIRPALAADPEFRVRFRREVAAARMVNGLFTALVIDADVDDVAPWLATAYVAGPSLAQAVRYYGPLPVDSVLALAAGLAESLAAIHAVGVVHRDLKPSNVLLAEDGPRVIDFGISLAAEATSLTNAGFVVGSPGFMSPEQAQGGRVGPPSDIFSLGAILAFAATGEGPFGGGSTAALVYRIVHSPPDLGRLPSQVRPLVERCLAKDPSQRPVAADFLVEAGAVQPVTGRLPEPVIGTSTQGPVQTSATQLGSDQTITAGKQPPSPTAGKQPPSPTAGKQPPSSQPSALQPQPGDRTRLRQRRFWRPLAMIWISGALLAAFAAAAHALDGVGSQSPGTHSRPPAAKSASASPFPAPSRRPLQSVAPPAATTYQVDVKGASWNSCSDEGSIHSVPSSAGELFTFVNNSPTNLNIIWLDFSGRRQLYDVLRPGRSYSVDTYIGHDWLITTSTTRCLGIFGIYTSGQIAVSTG